MDCRMHCVVLLYSFLVALAHARGLNGTFTRSTLSTAVSPTLTPSLTLTRNSSSNDDARSCNSKWLDWSWKSKNGYRYDVVTTITYGVDITTKYLGIQTCSSMCNDICYAGNLTTTGTIFITGTQLNTSVVVTETTTFSEPAPDCTIVPTACSKLWDEYRSAQKSFSSWLGTPSRTTVEVEPQRPWCTDGCVRTACSFGGGTKMPMPTAGVRERGYHSLQLLYWPETRNVSRDMCASKPTEPPMYLPSTASSYIPITTEGFVVQDGHTLYKGNVYISIPQLEVADNCGWATSIHDVAFPVASSDVYSQGISSDNYYTVNWADFIEPVPYSAYAGAFGRTYTVSPPEAIFSTEAYCKTAACGRSVLPGEYHPYIALPRAVQYLHPEFEGCEIDRDQIFFDPPIALTAVTNFLTSTKKDEPVTTPAAPASSPTTPPVQTALPIVTRPAAPPKNDPPAKTPSNPAQPADPAPVPSRNPPVNGPPVHNPPANTPRPTAGGSPNAPPPNEPRPTGGSPNDPPFGNPLPPYGSPVDPPVNNAPSDPNTPPSNQNPPPSNADSNSNNNGALPSKPSPPAITAGPTLLPLAPNNAGLIVTTSFTLGPSSTFTNARTTFTFNSGTLTLSSAGGSTVVPVTADSSGAIATRIPLADGGALAVSSGPAGWVLGVQSTIGVGDAPVTVGGGVVVTVGEGGVVVSTEGGEATSVAFGDVGAAGNGNGSATGTAPWEYEGAAVRRGGGWGGVVGLVVMVAVGLVVW